MSFNQKSGKNHQRKSSIKWNRIELYRKPVVVFEEKCNPKSQRETNIQSCAYEESSVKQDSRFILPSIIRQKPEKDSKISPNKSYFKNRFFTEKNTKEDDQEQKLFPVKQREKSIQIKKRSVINPWYKKLRKKQRNIILNYLNMKVQTQRVKKNKTKLKKSISNERIIERNQFVIVPTSQFKRHRRNFTEFKTQKVNKIKLDQTVINRRQSLPNYTPKEPLPLINHTIKSQKKNKIIDELKEKIQKIKEKQAQKEYETKRFNFTQQVQKKNHQIPLFKSLRKQQSSLKKQENFIDKRENFSQEDKEIRQIKKQIDIQNFYSKPEIKNNNLESPLFSEESVIKQKTLRDETQSGQSNESIKSSQQFIDKKEQIKNHQLTEEKQLEQPQQRNFELNSSKKLDTLDLKQWTQRQTIILKQTIKSEDQNYQRKNINKQSKNQEMKTQNLVEKINQNKEIVENQKYISENPNHQENQEAITIKKQAQSQILIQPPIPDKSFLQIKTYYAEVDKINQKQKNPSQTKQISQNFTFKKLPSSSKLVEFIENYNPLNEQVTLSQLMKNENFKILFQQNKELYFGLVLNEKKQGFGVTIKKNYFFEGQYRQDKKFKGVQINQVGKYIGCFRNNKRDGNGQFFWKNGQKYEGDWMNGKKHGKGVWSSPNGDIYNGQWVQGKVQGYGIHKSSNGQQYEGFFQEFLKSGRGRQILPNGDEYQGQFWKGKPHGKGKYCWKEGLIYEGQFSKGFREGYGTLTDGKGNIYKGEFKNQKASGSCEINFISKTFYKGQINNGFFDGQGTFKLQKPQRQWNGIWVLDEFVQALDRQQN